MSQLKKTLGINLLILLGYTLLIHATASKGGEGLDVVLESMLAVGLQVATHAIGLVLMDHDAAAIWTKAANIDAIGRHPAVPRDTNLLANSVIRDAASSEHTEDPDHALAHRSFLPGSRSKPGIVCAILGRCAETTSPKAPVC